MDKSKFLNDIWNRKRINRQVEYILSLQALEKLTDNNPSVIHMYDDMIMDLELGECDPV